jgi:2-polyprenylphenol 6-hydroxylase
MNYDVIINGAGIAGLTTACALAQKTRLTIAVIDTKPLIPSWQAEQYHHRVSAIALSTKRIFQNINAWQAMTTQRVSPFNHIQVWDQSSQADVKFDAADVGEPRLGYIVENTVMQDALLKRLQDFPQVTIHAPVMPEALEIHNDHVTIRTNKGALKGKLLIAADGANSWVRQQAGITLTTQDYGHDAIVATVRTTLTHEQTARQVFLDTGPLAFLPLHEPNSSSIVWSMSPEQAQEMLALDDESFKAKLGSAFSHRLGEIVEVSKRFSFPLKKQRANRYIASRIALIADAAHTVHPLAGQGLNVGLLDAAALVDVIIDAIKHDRDFSATTALRRYERWRKGENALMLSGIDSIKSLFCSNKQTSKALRSFSLSIAEQLPIIKNLFTRRAIGAHDGLPSLAVGEWHVTSAGRQ